MRTSRRTGRRSPLLAAVLALLLALAPAGAAAADVLATLDPRADPSTELVMSGTGPGRGVKGTIAPVGDTAFNPLAGYPSAPPAGFTAQNVGFAGIILAKPPGSSTAVQTYCIDLRTPTSVGYGYVLGEWSSAQVPLVGYVARILSEYYPNQNLPEAGGDEKLRAAAVQSAVWFFTDKFVLNTNDAAYPLTKAIVTDVIARGPEPSPVPPSLQIIPPDLATPEGVSGPIGSVLGPFTIVASSPATLSVTGGQLFADAAGTVPVTNPVADGTRVWIRSTTPGAATLSARAVATVPSGNVYLYDGKSAPAAAQKLILARTATVTTTATGTALFFDTGTLVVRKAVGGEGAGLQSDIVLNVVCNGAALPPITIPAGSATATYSTRIGPIRTPASCTVTESGTGANAAVSATGGGSITVSLPQNTTAGDDTDADLQNTFTQRPGSLTVTKTIGGAGAAGRSEIVIDVACSDGTARSFSILPGQTPPAGGFVVPDLPAGTTCSVTETTTGANAAVSADVTISPDVPVAVPAGGNAAIAVTNTFRTNPGSLVVTKTVAGPAQADRGDIVIDVTCDSGEQQQFTIPAGQAPDPAGYRVEGLPAGALCTVTEPQTGGTTTVAAEVVGAGTVVTIAAGAESPVALTNTFTLLPGSLVVTKTITGSPAALAARSDVAIAVVCDNGAIADYVVAAGAEPPAGGYRIDGLPAGTLCTVTETADGSNATVSVVAATTPPGGAATIPPAGTAEVVISDAFELRPASLVLTKGIVGTAAGLRSAIELLVQCSDGSQLAITIPAGQDPAPAGYRLDGIAGGATCSVTEVASGSNAQVTVLVTGLVDGLAPDPGGTATVEVTNLVAPLPGTFVVAKAFDGLGLTLRGEVRIAIRCTTPGTETPLVDDVWTIGPGTAPPARTYQVPADAVCTAQETADGANAQVAVVTNVLVDGQPASAPASVTIAPGGVSAIQFLNDYTERAGVLTLTKEFVGAGAGRQGPVQLDVRCATPEGSTLKPQEVLGTLVIPAGATAAAPLVLDGLPPGVTCTVTEPLTGTTTEVTVTPDLPGAAPIGAGEQVALTATNAVTPVPPVPPTPVPPAPVPPSPGLPDTGASGLGRTAGLGAALLALGVLLTVATHRTARRH